MSLVPLRRSAGRAGQALAFSHLAPPAHRAADLQPSSQLSAALPSERPQRSRWVPNHAVVS